MLRPVVNLAVVADRQDAVELLMNSPDLASAFKDVLKKVSIYPQGREAGMCASLPGYRRWLWLFPGPRSILPPLWMGLISFTMGGAGAGHTQAAATAVRCPDAAGHAVLPDDGLQRAAPLPPPGHLQAALTKPRPGGIWCLVSSPGTGGRARPCCSALWSPGHMIHGIGMAGPLICSHAAPPSLIGAQGTPASSITDSGISWSRVSISHKVLSQVWTN